MGRNVFFFCGKVYKETGRDRPAGVQSPTSTGKHQHHQSPNPVNPNRKRGTPRDEGDLKPNTTEQEKGNRPRETQGMCVDTALPFVLG